ncbi:unnamed protein product [Mucor hiemalis]
MSQTEVKETGVAAEPVEVTNKFDATQLKNAVDDELARFYTTEQNFKQSHLHTDIKLLLGYVSCFIAGGAFLYEYKTSFNGPFNFVVEKNEIFVGTQKVDGKVTGTLTISGKFDKFSPKYDLTFDYTDKSTGKSSTYKVEPNVAKWFTTKGRLVTEAMDKDLTSYLTKVQASLHQN